MSSGAERTSLPQPIEVALKQFLDTEDIRLYRAIGSLRKSMDILLAGGDESPRVNVLLEGQEYDLFIKKDNDENRIGLAVEPRDFIIRNNEYLFYMDEDDDVHNFKEEIIETSSIIEGYSEILNIFHPQQASVE